MSLIMAQHGTDGHIYFMSDSMNKDTIDNSTDNINVFVDETNPSANAIIAIYGDERYLSGMYNIYQSLIRDTKPCDIDLPYMVNTFRPRLFAFIRETHYMTNSINCVDDKNLFMNGEMFIAINNKLFMIGRGGVIDECTGAAVIGDDMQVSTAITCISLLSPYMKSVYELHLKVLLANASEYMSKINNIISTSTKDYKIYSPTTEISLIISENETIHSKLSN